MRVDHVMAHQGDWEGIFLDGHLFDQGHSIPVNSWLALLRELGVETSHTYDATAALGEDLDSFGGQFPLDFDEVRKVLDGD